MKGISHTRLFLGLVLFLALLAPGGAASAREGLSFGFGGAHQSSGGSLGLVTVPGSGPVEIGGFSALGGALSLSYGFNPHLALELMATGVSQTEDANFRFGVFATDDGERMGSGIVGIRGSLPLGSADALFARLARGRFRLSAWEEEDESDPDPFWPFPDPNLDSLTMTGKGTVYGLGWDHMMSGRLGWEFSFNRFDITFDDINGKLKNSGLHFKVEGQLDVSVTSYQVMLFVLFK